MGRTFTETERRVLGQKVRFTAIRKRLKGEKIGRPLIIVDAAKAIEALDNGTATIESLCVEHKIKKSALYRKLKAYRVTAMQ